MRIRRRLPPLSDGLDMNEAPSMYEMEGASSAPPDQAGQSPDLAGPTGRPPGPGTGTKARLPGLPASLSFPRVVPVSNGEVFLSRWPRVAQEVSADYFCYSARLPVMSNLSQSRRACTEDGPFSERIWLPHQ